jgi:predicted phosphohydrolase
MAFTDEKIRILWATDTHQLDQSASAADTSLAGAVSDCNDWKPNVLLLTGDGGSLNDLEDTKKCGSILDNLQRPRIWVVGNHDESGPEGSTTVDTIKQSHLLDTDTPMYKTGVLVSGDGSFRARWFALDGNVAADSGLRVGGEDGNELRVYNAAQRAFIQATLAADSDSNGIFVFQHHPPTDPEIANSPALVDLFQADGRPVLGFCGHVHQHAMEFIATSTDGTFTYPVYKAPALLDSGAWVRVTLSAGAGAINIDGLEIHNFTNPGGWTISAPFTLAS